MIENLDTHGQCEICGDYDYPIYNLYVHFASGWVCYDCLCKLRTETEEVLNAESKKVTPLLNKSGKTIGMLFER